MRKELTVYCDTNEEGAEVSVQRVAADPTFILLKLGPNFMVINKNELLEAISTIEYYSAAFDEEKLRKENAVKIAESRAAAKNRVTIVETLPVKTNKEEEGTMILDEDFTRGPTESELALLASTKDLFTSESITIKEEK